MPVSERIYLDNAATSWPKPETVYDAVTHYLRHIGASAGRSAYREAVDAERIVDDTRRHVARLVGAADANSIIFTSNGTDGLNLALYGVLRPGDHVGIPGGLPATLCAVGCDALLLEASLKTH